MIKTVVTFLLLVKVSPPQLALCIRMNLLVGLFLVLINHLFLKSSRAKTPGMIVQNDKTLSLFGSSSAIALSTIARIAFCRR